MSGGLFTTTTIFVYGLAIWLGLYLIGRDPRSARLLLTGSGLLAYALALACDPLSGLAPEGFGLVLERARWSLSLLPALLWTGALIHLLPEEAPLRSRLAQLWGVIVPPMVVLVLLMASVPTWLGPARWPAPVSRGL